MKPDFLRTVKLALYFVSFAEIFLFGYLGKQSGQNTKMMIIALGLLVLNILIYKLVSKKYKGMRANAGKND